jgi:hypothetical protein
VGDRGDTSDGPPDTLAIADVPLHQLDAVVEVGGPDRVDSGVDRVEDSDLVPARQQRVGDVRADEAGPSGDKDRSLHAPRLTRRAFVSAISEVMFLDL